MSTIKITDTMVETLVQSPDALVSRMENAISTYRDDILRDVRLMRQFQRDHANYYAVWCNVSAILSNGMELNLSFDAAHAVASMMMVFPDVPMSWEDVDAIIKTSVPGAGSLPYGSSVTSISLQWTELANWTPERMTFANIYKLRGMGEKTASWSCALWNHHASVMTLDRWMLRGMFELPQKGSVSIAKTLYFEVAEMMLSIADALECPPLVAQWSLWNLYRNDVHADHSRAVPEWYRNVI